LSHNSICCIHCGREFATVQEHFIPKCTLQHELRTRVVCAMGGIRSIKREMEILQKFVDENCSHVTKDNKEE
jgi:hypothetical protein